MVAPTNESGEWNVRSTDGVYQDFPFGFLALAETAEIRSDCCHAFGDQQFMTNIVTIIYMPIRFFGAF